MIINSLFNLGNGRRDKFCNASVNFTTTSHERPGQTRRELARTLQENQNNMLKEAHNRIAEQQREQRAEQRRNRRRTGAVRLSNTDSVGRAHQIRARLLAKLKELHGSDAEGGNGTAVMDIKM